MKLTATILLGAALASTGLHAQFRPAPRYTLTAGQVARILSPAFAARGIEIGDAQVSLPVSVLANTAEPALEVRSIEPLGRLASDSSDEVSSAVKLVCKQPHTCIPFYAIVTLPADALLPGSSTSAALKTARLALKQAPVEYAMRAGVHVMLQMEDGMSHIQLEVITLEKGELGHTIRVSSIDHKHIYKAEVISANLLKGSF